jgi:hypothetical protein
MAPIVFDICVPKNPGGRNENETGNQRQYPCLLIEGSNLLGELVLRCNKENMCCHCGTEGNSFNPSEKLAASPVQLAPVRTGLVPTFDDVPFDSILKIMRARKPGSDRIS